MKKKMKMLFAIIIVLVSGFLLVNSEYIIALAKSMDVEEYETGKVYNKGDELLLYLNTEDSYKITERVHVAYLDSEDNLLDFHSVVYSNGSGKAINSFFVGDTCIDTNKRHPEYSETDYSLNVRCNNTNTYLFNYVIDEDKLHEVEHWKLIDNEEKTIVDYCVDYELDESFCDYIVENQYGSGTSHYIHNTPLLVFKQYEKPVFNMVCDSETVKFGEKVNCKLAVDSTDQLESFKTSLDNEHFDVSDIQVSEGWEYEKEDGAYVFTKDNEDIDGGDILSFVITPKERKAMETSVIANDFIFTTSFDLVEEVSVSTKLNIEVDKVDNPNTYDNKIHIVIGLLIIASGIFVVFYNNKSRNSFEQLG